MLCSSYHAKKTAINNKNKIHKNGGTTKSVSVCKKGDEEFKKEYSKIRDVISELDIKEARITYSLKTGKYVGSKNHSNKYKFVFNDITNDDEIFKKHPTLNIIISNHGRVKNKNGINNGTYKGGYKVTGVYVNKKKEIKVIIQQKVI